MSGGVNLHNLGSLRVIRLQGGVMLCSTDDGGYVVACSQGNL